MRTIVMAALAAVVSGGISAAMAGETHRAVRSGPQFAVGETVRKGLEDLGYSVDRMKIEHGRLQLRAVNETGLPVKLTYDAATGEMLRAALRRTGVEE